MQKIELPEDVRVEIWNGHWTRQDAIDNPDKLFLFGGNVMQDYNPINVSIPKKSQARIRGLENALPVITKLSMYGSRYRKYGITIERQSPYFNDGLLPFFINLLEETREKLSKSHYKIIVLPADGIGTGLAYLDKKAPKCWEALQEFLQPLYDRANEQVKT